MSRLVRCRRAAAAAAVAATAGTAAAEVLGFTAITLEDPPTADLSAEEIDALNGDFGVIGPADGPDPDITASTAIMTSFTTSAGTVTGLNGPTQIIGLTTSPPGLEPPAGDTVRNVWGFLGEEIDGAASLLGVNVGAGTDNAGADASFDVLFGVGIVGAEGAANDFFIVDIIGDDAVSLAPLDAQGNVIGDFELTIASGPGANNFANDDLGDFGLAGFDLALVLENAEAPPISQPTGTVVNNIPLAGAAFDIEDFASLADPSAVLGELYGFRITALDPPAEVSSGEGSIDLIAIGFTDAAVPAPGAAGAIALAGLALGRRRRR